MTRDIIDRLEMFLEPHWDGTLEVERIALNMNQVRQYGPPPNPAKPTDSRYEHYKRTYGENCWELDALNPQVIDKLITDKILKYREDEAWDFVVNQETIHRTLLSDCANRWDEVKKFLQAPPKPPRKPRAKKAKKKK